MSRTPAMLVLAALAVAAGSVFAQTVDVPGSEFEFEAEIVKEFENKPVKLRLTGVALRERFFININAYAVGSYLDDDVAGIETPEQLAAADVPKALQMKVERDFKGKTIAEAFEKGILKNYPREKFAAELVGFKNFFMNAQVTQNTEVWFLHVPGKGLRCSIGRENEMQIPSVEFAHAFWDIYFGEHPVNDKIKKSLISRL